MVMFYVPSISIVAGHTDIYSRTIDKIKIYFPKNGCIIYFPFPKYLFLVGCICASLDKIYLSGCICVKGYLF